MIFTSVEDVAALLQASTHRIVAIVGPPGAGKSTIAAALIRHLEHAALLPMDGFHLPQATLVELGRRDRMGAPDTFDVAALRQTLTEVRAGETVLAPDFDRYIEEAVPGAIRIDANARPVIAEGNYLLLDSDGWQHIAPLVDLSFFVELDPPTRQQRLIDRHIRFGKSLEDARAWALGTDERNAQLITATAARADHIIRLE